MRLVAAPPEEPEDLDRFGEALPADRGLRPALADDVLVEVFTVPTPRKNRPSIIAAAVAAACAMIAGWMRTVGHVTPVPSRSFEVASATPPITHQTNGLCPCLSIHGWKWSEISANVKPASSAPAA